MRIKVSVITPTLNSEKYIYECLKSVACQNSTEIEVKHIVVDGGSNDETRNICSTFETFSKIQFISEPGSTQSKALNVGLSKVERDVQWIGWLNADERYEPEAFQQLLLELPSDEHACVLYGDFNRIDAAGQIIKKNLQWTYDREIGKLLTPIIQNCAALFNSNCLPDPFISEEYNFIMDWDFYVRLLNNEEANAIYVPKIIGNYTMQPQSKTAKNQKKFLAEIKQFKQKNYPNVSDLVLYWYRKILILKFFLILIKEKKFLYKVFFKIITQRKYKNLFGS